MRHLREILRLKQEVGLTHRAIAEACGVASSTVSLYLDRAAAAGVAWPLPADLDDATLEGRLFVRPFQAAGVHAKPDVVEIHRELSQRGVMLQLLWQEYRLAHPQGYSYSQYCQHYRAWVRRLKSSTRQVHKAGEKVFVDFAGQKGQIVNGDTGEVIPVEIFVGVLGASGLLYAEASLSQDLPSWVAAHVRMLEAFGGSPAIWVPDNLRSAVTRPHRYEPEINRTYQDLAHHYGAVVIPARIRRPQDKALAEIGVLLAERWILAALRHRTFFTLEGLNTAITERVRVINARPMKRLGVSRQTRYEQLDRSALRPLPPTRFQLAEWTVCRVNVDYHIEVDHNWYSVPHRLLHEEVEARATATTVEVFFQHERVASHARWHGQSHHAVTDPAHMPRGHWAYAEWTPERLVAWAGQTGPATARVVAAIMARRAHPEQGFRACLGLMRLGRGYGAERLEAACLRAERLQSYSYRTIENILRSGQDRVSLPDADDRSRVLPFHPNVRGAAYYRRKERMMLQITLDKLRRLRLAAFADALEQQLGSSQVAGLGFEERVGLLVDHEWTAREQRALTRRLRAARLRYPASLENIDYQRPRGLNRQVLLSLATGAWIRARENVVVVSPAGIGKSYIASACVESACRHGFTAVYLRTPRVLQELAVSRGDGSYSRLLARLAKVDLLALDDWLLTPLSDPQRRDLLEVIEDRSERGSTLVAGQLPTDAWHQAIGEPTLADAICDRLLHRAHRIEMKGPSMRDPRPPDCAVQEAVVTERRGRG